MTAVPKPHLRIIAPGVWQCVVSRTERHITRGVAAPTPMEAYNTWKALIEIVPISQLLIEKK